MSSAIPPALEPKRKVTGQSDLGHHWLISEQVCWKFSGERKQVFLMLLYIKSSSNRNNNLTTSSGCTTYEHPLQSTCCMQSLTLESTTTVPSFGKPKYVTSGIKANAEFNKTQMTSLHGKHQGNWTPLEVDMTGTTKCNKDVKQDVINRK